MSTKKEEIRTAVLAGMKKHAAARRNPSMQKNATPPFTSISAICNYLYEFEFLLDNARAKEAIESGKSIDKYVVASANTVRTVIEDLYKEGTLQYDGFEYTLNETFSLERAHFPILQIADRISIEMLPPEDVMFLSAPPQYVSAITDYINAVFYKRDVVATAMGNLIICMSVYPLEAFEDGFTPNPKHTERFFSQLTGALADFNLAFRDFKYGDDYYLNYGQHYDPTMVHAVDDLVRNMATFDGREFDKRTYEKCKYFMTLAMKGERAPLSIIDDLKRDDPALYKYFNEFFNGLFE